MAIPSHTIFYGISVSLILFICIFFARCVYNRRLGNEMNCSRLGIDTRRIQEMLSSSNLMRNIETNEEIFSRLNHPPSNFVYRLEYEPPNTPPRSKKIRFNPENLKRVQVEEDEQNSLCPICLEKFGTKMVSSGPCSHKIHHECLTNWLLKDIHSSCPVCRCRYGEESPRKCLRSSESPGTDSLQDIEVESLHGM